MAGGVHVKLMLTGTLRMDSVSHAPSEAETDTLYRPGASASPGASAFTARSTSIAPGGALGSVEGASSTRSAANPAAAGARARLRGRAPPLEAARAAKNAVPGLLDVGARVHTRVPAEALRETVHPGEPGTMSTPGAAGAATPTDTLHAML